MCVHSKIRGKVQHNETKHYPKSLSIDKHQEKCYTQSLETQSTGEKMINSNVL